MTEKIDLKRIERRSYLSYHQDGLIDIAVGAYLLVFGLMMMILMDVAWVAGPVVGCAAGLITSSWVGIKQKVTAPRIGSVKFARTRIRHTFYVKIMVVLVTVILAALAIGVGLLLEMEGTGSQPLLLLLAKNATILVGIGGAVLSAIVATSMRMRRFYLYGLMNLTVFVVGQLLMVPLQFAVMAVGGVIMASGLVLLRRFLSRYPL
jgi:hypothetical protein